MKKLNIYTSFGLVFSTIWLLSKRFNILNNSLEGIFVGVGLTLILFGIITKRYDIYEFKERKNNLFKYFNRKKSSKKGRSK
ncbi:MAG: hypothetical protein RSD36_10940 [Terrisporobacter sp.]